MSPINVVYFVGGFSLGAVCAVWCYESLVRGIRKDYEERWKGLLSTQSYEYKGRR